MHAHGSPLQERVATEATGMRLAHELAPSHVPSVLLYDKAASIMVCDFLEGCQDMTSLVKVRGRARQPGGLRAEHAYLLPAHLAGPMKQSRAADVTALCLAVSCSRVASAGTCPVSWAPSWPAWLTAPAAAPWAPSALSR
jgi:hypothetical protein